MLWCCNKYSTYCSEFIIQEQAFNILLHNLDRPDNKTDKMNKILYSIIFLFLLACKNQKQNQEKKDSVNEKSFIKLGGEDQYVEITGTSDKDPVLLFLHGGPGWPQTPHLRYFNSELTRSMIVVAWEQSGCGRSYMANPNPKNLNLDQIIKDAHELTQLLKKKFNKDKIYLAGFSWGSMIGLMLAEKYPEDYSAYIGITQVIDINKSMKASREWLKEQTTLKKDDTSLKIIDQIEKGDTSICNRPLDCFLKQFELVSKYGGAIYRKESEIEIQKAETQYEDYKKYDWFGAFKYSAYRLEKDIFATDLSSIKEIKIPVYFFMGRHDWNLPTAITVDYYNTLTAPKKEIVWFENSGHEPLEEEADLFNKKMIERITK
jgi:pimeloyl-ACP methyl ester carboxylesterase